MKTEKRSVNEDCIRLLKNADLSHHEELKLTRDLFLFSFYTMGMPFVDIAYLKKSQINDTMLVYRRHKTHQLVKVPLCKSALHIINMHKDSSSTYAFPILTPFNENSSHLTPRLRRYAPYLGLTLCNLFEVVLLNHIEDRGLKRKLANDRKIDIKQVYTPQKLQSVSLCVKIKLFP